MKETAEFERLAQQFSIAFDAVSGLKQTQEEFTADLGEGPRRFHIHDYDTIYSVPFLYEAALFGALGCRSPYSIAEILTEAEVDGLLADGGVRMLEIGAGSGLFGELMRARFGLERLVGLDLSPSAKQAAERTRPGVYDLYLTADVTTLDQLPELEGERFTLVGGVSATGPGHIPPEGLDQAFAQLAPGGLFLFHARGDDGNVGPAGYNIHAEWLRRMKESPAFETLLEAPCFHRRAADGTDIYYQVVLARKAAA